MANSNIDRRGYSNSRIVNINVEKINEYLNDDGVAVIPGFQGISKKLDITTIGRGGSDATAVAVAKLLSANTCEIYTDVDGVFQLTQIKFQLQKLIRYLMMKCLNFRH